jgi:hypothetical protein
MILVIPACFIYGEEIRPKHTNIKQEVDSLGEWVCPNCGTLNGERDYTFCRYCHKRRPRK